MNVDREVVEANEHKMEKELNNGFTLHYRKKINCTWKLFMKSDLEEFGQKSGENMRASKFECTYVCGLKWPKKKQISRNTSIGDKFIHFGSMSPLINTNTCETRWYYYG